MTSAEFEVLRLFHRDPKTTNAQVARYLGISPYIARNLVNKLRSDRLIKVRQKLVTPPVWRLGEQPTTDRTVTLSATGLRLLGPLYAGK